jgi:hypothetical protein
MNAHWSPQLYAQFCADLRAEFGDDDDLVADMLEAETDIHDVIGKLLVAEAEADAMEAANKSLAAVYTGRASMQSARKEAVRGALWRLMDATGLRKVQHALGTLSTRAVPPSLVVEDVHELPASLQTVKVTANVAAIKAALAEGQDVPGARLTNGGETISIRRK